MSSNNNSNNPEDIEDIKKRKLSGVILINLGLFLSFVFGVASGLYSYDNPITKITLTGLTLLFVVLFVIGFVLLLN